LFYIGYVFVKRLIELFKETVIKWNAMYYTAAIAGNICLLYRGVKGVVGFFIKSFRNTFFGICFDLKLAL